MFRELTSLVPVFRSLGANSRTNATRNLSILARRNENLVKLLSLSSSRRNKSDLTSATNAPPAVSTQKYDPNNYSIPLRMPTMDDLMEPYGEYDRAYEKEKRLGNISIFRGAIALIISCVIFNKSGVADEIWMPNLDNIIADTDPHKKWPEYEEDRIVVRYDQDQPNIPLFQQKKLEDYYE